MREIEGVAELSSVHMSLRLSAVTKQSQGFAKFLLEEIGIKKLLNKRVLAISAIVGDLIRGAACDPPQVCYRPLASASFKGLSIGHHSFTDVIKRLDVKGYLTIYKGRPGDFQRRGVSSRIECRSPLINVLKKFGITVDNYKNHYKDESSLPIIFDVVRLKSSSKRGIKAHSASSECGYGKIPGRKMGVDYSDPKVAEISKQVFEVNRFLSRKCYDGMNFEGLFRGFNEGDVTDYGWNKGGRLYAVGGGYQSIRREDRSSIRINGEPVAEVDIGASHLTILHSLAGVPLPNRPDPYEIEGVSRDSVKRFITMTIGNGKVPRCWSQGAVEAYAKGFDKSPSKGLVGSLQKDHPFKSVRDVVLKHIPLLASLPEHGISWADLQYHESEVLIDALLSLIRRRVVCLPLHDSLIGRVEDSSKISRQITSSFKKKFNVNPIIKIKITRNTWG